MVNVYASVNKFCFILCYLCPPMYLSLGISKSVYNQTLFEIPPPSHQFSEVAVSGSRQTKQFSTFQGGGHQVSVPSVIRPMYTPITWRMCLAPDILLKFRD